jgi:multimeric flavodoxin WrbA
MRNTIALFSSARRHGNTGQLMDRIAGELTIELIDLGAKRVAAYTYEHGNRHDDFEPLMQHVLQFDRIIFASPIYWYAVSTPMKNFLDRISDYLDLPELLNEGRRLRGKIAYVVCTSVLDVPAPEFIGAFRQTFEYLGMQFGGYLHVNCESGPSPASSESDLAAFLDLLRR